MQWIIKLKMISCSLYQHQPLKKNSIDKYFTHLLGAPLVHMQGSELPGSDYSGFLCSSSSPSSSENVGHATARSPLDHQRQVYGNSGHWPSAPLWQGNVKCHYSPFIIRFQKHFITSYLDIIAPPWFASKCSSYILLWGFTARHLLQILLVDVPYSVLK